MTRVYLPGHGDDEIGGNAFDLLVDSFKLDFGIILDVSFQLCK